MESVIKPLLPLLAWMIGALMLITYVPWITLILPRLLLDYPG